MVKNAGSVKKKINVTSKNSAPEPAYGRHVRLRDTCQRAIPLAMMTMKVKSMVLLLCAWFSTFYYIQQIWTLEFH